MPAAASDRIEKRILLRASRDRVWRALTDSHEFGTWFGMRFTEPFAAGKRMTATIVPTAVDRETAAMQKQFEGLTVEIVVERIEPKRLFSYRWHPGAVDPKVDYGQEPMTLVEFVLDDAEAGILLTVTESGFDKIPLARRASAFSGNDDGWTKVVTLIEKYLEQKP
ncbi:MAG TPA: SRPBCC family protein [Gemmatimonadaceae bacterium]|jgi:uncharacterized protein YndB with AHSA1/START domain|nr:SRPBCC family protein [Gemmatimonadaceae bacterium]